MYTESDTFYLVDDYLYERVVKKNMKKQEEFNKMLCETVYDITGEDISNVTKLNKNGMRFNERFEIWKPTRADLTKTDHHHYNPNALVQVFVDKDFWIKYDMIKLAPKIMPKYKPQDGKRLRRGWICIESDDDFRNLISHLYKNGYTWLR